jgi:hypothetical protein
MCWGWWLPDGVVLGGLPDQVVESLYGQDLDSGHHGSGFPLPPFRQRLLEAHLAQAAAANTGAGAAAAPKQEVANSAVEPRQFTPEEAVYSEHKWNINNMPRCKARPFHPCPDPLLFLQPHEWQRGAVVKRAWNYCKHAGLLLAAACDI